MPEMDGFEATKIIKEMCNSGAIYWPLTIIIVSAFSSTEDIDYAFFVGADDYIQKPI